MTRFAYQPEVRDGKAVAETTHLLAVERDGASRSPRFRTRPLCGALPSPNDLLPSQLTDEAENVCPECLDRRKESR